MKPLIFKIRKTREFSALKNNSKRIISMSFIVLYELEIHQETVNLNGSIAFGVIASKKIGKAVKRNKCKRIMRSLVREVLAPPILGAQLKLILIARQSLLLREYELLKREVRYCMHKIAEHR